MLVSVNMRPKKRRKLPLSNVASLPSLFVTTEVGPGTREVEVRFRGRTKTPASDHQGGSEWEATGRHPGRLAPTFQLFQLVKQDTGSETPLYPLANARGAGRVLSSYVQPVARGPHVAQSKVLCGPV